MENQYEIDYNCYFELTADIINDLIINPWELSFDKIYVVKEDFYSSSFFQNILNKDENFEENNIKKYSKSIIQKDFRPKYLGCAEEILKNLNCFDYDYLKKKSISDMNYFELCLIRYIIALNSKSDFLFIELYLDNLCHEERTELFYLIFKNRGRKTVFVNENYDELIYKYADYIISFENNETKLYPIREYIFKSIF